MKTDKYLLKSLQNRRKSYRLDESRSQKPCAISVQALSPSDANERSRIHNTLVNVFQKNYGTTVEISRKKYIVEDVGQGRFEVHGLLAEDIYTAQDNLTKLFSVQGYSVPSITVEFH